MDKVLKRGQKICKACQFINAARQRVCTNCDQEFILKGAPIKNEVIDWKTLDKGDYIKVVQGTGPYYISKKDNEQYNVGEKICMGDTGVYKVVDHNEDGILSFGASPNNSGFTYLYMGKKQKSTDTGIYLEPYRIIKIKRKIKRE